MYTVRGRNSATAATANHAVAALWNPHASQRIKFAKVHMICQTAPGGGLAYRFRRITARGTPGSTVTPDINNDTRYAIAPPSGVLLDLGAYSVQPTMVGELGPSWVPAAVAGSALIVPVGLEIPFGTGIAIVQVAATVSPVFEIVTEWYEDW